MDEGTFGLILLLVIGIIVSIVSHIFSRKYLIATVISALIASLIFCIAAWVHKPTALIGIAFGFISIYCFVISAIIGLPFYLIRKKNQEIK
jgi:hypothetical protein